MEGLKDKAGFSGVGISLRRIRKDERLKEVVIMLFKGVLLILIVLISLGLTYFFGVLIAKTYTFLAWLYNVILHA